MLKGPPCPNWRGAMLKRIVRSGFLALSIVAILIITIVGCEGAPNTDKNAETQGQELASSSPSLQLQVITNSCGANQTQDFFQVTNTGGSSINLSDISIKFWIDDTSGQTVVPHVWTGGCVVGVNGNPSCIHQVSGVTATSMPFSPACGPDATHQANTEITITDTDGSTLPPGASWNNIQSALNLANYGNFSPGTQDWYSPCLSGSSYVSDPHFAVYFQGNLVFSNGINAPDCRAPHGSQRLHGYTSILAASTVPVLGPVDPSEPIALEIGLPAQPGLQAFATTVSDPHSPSFRQYIDIPTFAGRFGASVNDYSSLVAWANGAGFTVTNTFPNRLLVRVVGTAAQIEQALFTNLFWRERQDTTRFVAVDRDPSLNLSANVLAISGLTDWLPPKGGAGTAPGGGPSNQNYWGADFRNAYFQNCLTLPDGTPLDGRGQTVAVLSLNSFATGDIQQYDSSVTPQLNPANVVNLFAIAAPDPGNGIGGTPQSEVALDIEAVQSMAPGATVDVISENLSWEGHADAAYHAIATTPGINVATSSWYFSFSSNAQQAVWEMEAQGISMFQHSGDFGNVGDPETNQDMDGQTLVGGTILNTNALGPGNSYPNPYYSSEQSWVDGNGASSGGIMDGHGSCYALESCPPPFVPPYQATVPMNTNGGSTSARDYPDVALDVYNVQVFQGANTGSVGTSLAAPLWAGVAALVDQEALAKGAKRLGFANPTIYGLGLTRGQSPDLYATTFNDIQDGAINNTACLGGTQCFRFPGILGIPQSGCTCPPTHVIPGFASVAGYDLVTGWGTPTCGLLGQLTSNTPLTAQTKLTQVALQITTGKDDLRQNSAATADLFFVGQSAPVVVQLKSDGEGAWDAGTIHAFTVNVPSALTITPDLVAAGLAGVSNVTLNLIEDPGNSSTGEDNWDVGALNVRLFAPSNPVGEICQLDLVETSATLGNTNDPGVVRLTASVSSSGSGPIISIPLSGTSIGANPTPPLTAGQSTGCVATGSPSPAQPAQAQFIISTGSDTIRGDSSAQVQVFGSTAQGTADTSVPAFLQSNLSSGGQSGDVFNVKLPVPANAPPPSKWQVVLTLTTHNSFIETDDHWDVGGVNVMTWNANQPEQCVLLATGDPAISQLGGSKTLPANNCH
jgi:hypothetical protein